MIKVSKLICFIFFTVMSCNSYAKCNFNCSKEIEDGKIETFDGSGYISEKESPNFETLRWSLYRKIFYRPSKGQRFYSVRGNNSYNFNKDLQEDQYIKEQLKNTPLLSYLLYEEGKIKIDAITPKNRFGDIFSHDTMYHSMSMGKSITSYLIGHAICEGKIESIEARLNDWPVLKDTLYYNQKLINFLNMNTGDQDYSKNDESNLSIEKRMISEFYGSKKSSSIYNYTNLNTNIVISYLWFKYGDNEFKNFLNNIFQNKIRIENEIYLNKIINAEKKEKSLGHQFFATRYDYLRIAVAMLEDWQNNTCVGNYLKTIHKKRIPKNGAQGSRGRVGLPLSYAGFFHTGYKGMENRPVMGMDGNGGQTILIDFERNRIIATLSVFDNMKFPKRGSFDFKKISYNKIKFGKKTNKSNKLNSEKNLIIKKKLVTQNNIREENYRKEKIYWDKYFEKLLYENLDEILISENFENIKKLKVQDYDNNWEIQKDNNGNSFYCNKVQNRWTEFNFGQKNWPNYSVSYKIKFYGNKNNEVETETHIRMSEKGRYTAVIKKFSEKALIELKEFISQETIDKGFISVQQNDWYNVELSASSKVIKILINDKLVVNVMDKRLQKGSAMIAVNANSKVCIDDIIVKKL